MSESSGGDSYGDRSGRVARSSVKTGELIDIGNISKSMGLLPILIENPLTGSNPVLDLKPARGRVLDL